MSTINYTYNVLVDRFRQFADGHFQLRRFTHGEISQADLEKEAEWPWLHVKPRAINYSPGTRSFSFEIFISDLPRDKEDKTGYQAESITDCSLIFQDLINEIYLGNMFGSDVVLTRPVNSEPFVEQYTHTLTGVTGTIELNLDYDWSACSIPASWNYNTPTDSGTDGWGALQFIESLDQNGAFVSLLNDVEAPGNSYYYGTNASGVKGWYAIVDNVGLTCETLPDCATIISIVDDIEALESGKVDKVAGKGLSTEDYTTAEKSKLAGIQAGAEVNVNADWNAVTGDAQILNKPTIPSIAGLVSETRTLTINGTTQDLSADRTWSVGTFNLPSLTSGSVLFSNGTTIAQDNANLFWDDTNNRLGIGTATPSNLVHISDGSPLSSSINDSAAYLFLSRNNSPIGIYGSVASNTTGHRTVFASIRAGGTTASPTAVASGFQGLTILSGLFDGTSIQYSAGLFFDAESNASAGNAPQLINLVTGSTGANRSTKMQVRSNGNVLIGTTTDAGFRLDVNGTTRLIGATTVAGSINASGGFVRGTFFNQTLVATANNDTLYGIDINPTYTTGAFTGVTLVPLRIRNAANTGNAFYVDSVGNATLGASLNVNTIYGSTVINLSSGSGDLRLQTNFTSNTGLTMFQNTRNVVIQNGGTFTDAGFRLDVNGTTMLRGIVYGVGTTGNAIQLASGIGTGTALIGGSAGTPLRFQGQNLQLLVGSTQVGQFFDTTGNLRLQNGGTFTDSGYRLDVQGTTRFSGSAIFGSSITVGGATAINNSLAVGTNLPAVASAQLEVISTTRGFLPPRMTTTQKNAIASPATGLVVFDTTLNKLCVYTTAWETITSV